MMHSKPLKYTALNISAATAELVKGILVLCVWKRSIGNSNGLCHRPRVPLPLVLGSARTLRRGARQGVSVALRATESHPRRPRARGEPLAGARRRWQPASAAGHRPDGGLETRRLRCIVHRLEAPVMVRTAQLCRRMSQFYASSCQAQNQKSSESLGFYI